MVLSALQPANAELGILESPSPMETLVKAEHELKQTSFILDTLGKSAVLSYLQDKKARSPSDVTSDKSMASSLPQSLKA